MFRFAAIVVVAVLDLGCVEDDDGLTGFPDSGEPACVSHCHWTCEYQLPFQGWDQVCNFNEPNCCDFDFPQNSNYEDDGESCFLSFGDTYGDFEMDCGSDKDDEYGDPIVVCDCFHS